MRSTRMQVAAAVVGAVVVVTAANSDIVQVFDPGDLIGGPFTVEDFEDHIFEPGATYSASTGIHRTTAEGATDGVTPSGVWGLIPNTFPDPITVTLDEPASSVGMWFGNDDTCCTTGFFANLDIFGPEGLIGTISVEANMNDWADQFIGFNSNEMVTSVTLRYGTGADVGLFHYIDDVYFASAPRLADRTLIIKQGACPAPVNPTSRGLTPIMMRFLNPPTFVLRPRPRRLHWSCPAPR